MFVLVLRFPIHIVYCCETDVSSFACGGWSSSLLSVSSGRGPVQAVQAVQAVQEQEQGEKEETQINEVQMEGLEEEEQVEKVVVLLLLVGEQVEMDR